MKSFKDQLTLKEIAVIFQIIILSLPDTLLLSFLLIFYILI